MPEATVIAVGPGAQGKDGKVVPVSVSIGDRVLLPGWGGSPIKVGEEVSGFAEDLPSFSLSLAMCLADCQIYKY